MRRSSHHTMAVNGVTGVDGSANSPLVGGGLVMIQNGCGELPNAEADQRRTMGSTIPLDSIRRLIQRLVSSLRDPLLQHPLRTACRNYANKQCDRPYDEVVIAVGKRSNMRI